MSFQHPHRYGLMVLVSKKDYRHLNKYKKELIPFVKFFMKPEPFGDIAPQHISMCYFSYPERYTKEYIKKLEPRIISIVKKYLPLKVSVRGLKGAWDLNLGVPAILWNIQNFKEINLMHKELIEELKKDIDHFNEPELDFTPHIGIALGDAEKIDELNEIIKKSRQDKEIELTLDRVQIFYPTGTEEIFKID